MFPIYLVIQRGHLGGTHTPLQFHHHQIKIRDKWEYGRSNGKGTVKMVLASERMDKKEVREEYRRKVCKRLREDRMTVRGNKW